MSTHNRGDEMVLRCCSPTCAAAMRVIFETSGDDSAEIVAAAMASDGWRVVVLDGGDRGVMCGRCLAELAP